MNPADRLVGAALMRGMSLLGRVVTWATVDRSCTTLAGTGEHQGLPMTRDPKVYATTDGKPADPNCEGTGAPKPIDPATGQHGSYWVLTEEERAKGFVRPVRRSYQHLTCKTVTTMGIAIAETYAAQPGFYGATFCCRCGTHLPVGEAGEFVWIGVDGMPTTEKVGT